MKVPCNGCKKRHVACHCSCEKYAQFKTELSRLRGDRVEAGIVDYEQRRYLKNFETMSEVKYGTKLLH